MTFADGFDITQIRYKWIDVSLYSTDMAEFYIMNQTLSSDKVKYMIGQYYCSFLVSSKNLKVSNCTRTWIVDSGSRAVGLSVARVKEGIVLNGKVLHSHFASLNRVVLNVYRLLLSKT